MRNVIGIDLGGTRIKYALVSEMGEIHYESETDSKADESSKTVIAQIELAIDDVLQYARSKNLEVYGVGIGSPGIIDTVSGTVIGKTENFKDWENIPLSEILKNKYPCPIYVDNDANVMGLAETTYGAGQHCRDVILLSIGIGIGGAITINGQPYGGQYNRGAELGHFPLVANGERCRCGSFGCFEQYASITALIRRYGQRLAENKKPIPSSLDFALILQKYQEQEAEAIEAIHENCDFIGHAIAGYINIFSPEKIILAGDIAQADDFYIEQIKKAAQKYAIPDCAVNTSIEKGLLGDKAGCIGAAGLVFTA